MSSLLVYVNDKPVSASLGITVLQVCESVGISLPRFCYHDLLNVAGNCRICLVEIQNSPKPHVACGLPVVHEIKIYTDSPLVKKAREAVLEFLLLNHPLDCPICDQAGQCDLQNQARRYGSLRGRFYETKRGVPDKSFGPLVKTVITRCIHCTRCVRFLSEIAGVETLGTTLRGYKIEIGTYVKKPLISEISANIIDLCPVGALTTKPRAFKTRPWEVNIVKSIDTIDSLGSHITIEVKSSIPIRIVPRSYSDINQEWITDIARFSYEGFLLNRLEFSYYNEDFYFHKFISTKSIKSVLKNYVLGQSALKIVFGQRVDLDIIQRGLYLNRLMGWDFIDDSFYKLFTTYPSFIQGISYIKDLNSIDFCLILGINSRIEASLFNIRLLKSYKTNNLITTSLGSSYNSNFLIYNIGLNYKHLVRITMGKHALNTTKSKHSLLLFGDVLAKRFDAQSALLLSYSYQNSSVTTNLKSTLRIPIGANAISNAYLGISFPFSREIQSPNLNYLVSTDNEFLLKSSRIGSIYENSHLVSSSDKYIFNFKFILPLITEYEKNSKFINCEGRLQKTQRFINFVDETYTTKDTLRDLMLDRNIEAFKFPKVFSNRSSLHLHNIVSFNNIIKIINTPLTSLFKNIYAYSPITKSSKTLFKAKKTSRRTIWDFNDTLYFN